MYTETMCNVSWCTIIKEEKDSQPRANKSAYSLENFEAVFQMVKEPSEILKEAQS